jgi:hypothetical protein
MVIFVALDSFLLWFEYVCEINENIFQSLDIVHPRFFSVQLALKRLNFFAIIYNVQFIPYRDLLLICHEDQMVNTV